MTHEHSAHRLTERRGLVLAIIFTGTILLAEIIGGILTNSLALLADAGHMFVDVASLAMSFLALTFALRPPSQERTYGFHRLMTSRSVDIVERVQSLLKRDFGIAHTTLQCECEYCPNGERVCVLESSTFPQAEHKH